MLELERPGSGRVAERVRPGRIEGAVSKLALVRAVLLHCRRALDRERGDDEGRQERRRLGRQVDDGRVLALGRAAPVEALGERAAVVVLVAVEDGLPVVVRGRILERPAEVVLAVEVGTHGSRIEGRAVRELDMPTKQEVPVLPVLREPLRRQSRPDQSRAGLERDKAFEDLLRDPEGLAVGDERRVEVGRVGRAGDDERPSRLRRATGRAHRRKRGNGHQHEGEPATDSAHEKSSFLADHGEYGTARPGAQSGMSFALSAQTPPRLFGRRARRFS